jgi:general secretion pathway protein N
LKRGKKSWLGLVALTAVAGVLLYFFPARWALPWLEPTLHGLRLQQVQGPLWDGRAGQVLTATGRPLGQLHWRLSRRALFGQIRLQVELQGPLWRFSGTMQRLSQGQVEWRQITIDADPAMWQPRPVVPWGQPRGQVQMTVARALLQGGWPLQLQANAQWQHAVMRTRAGDVALGDLRWHAQAQNGVIAAQLSDDGRGPLQVDGQMQLSPLGWRLDAKLRTRHTDPALRRWLAGLGAADADGVVHVRRNGGLFAGMPPPSTGTHHPHEP